ncbi:hypothetical protein ACFGVR_20605 [Mucilaginibacter sp. AW1-3]
MIASNPDAVRKGDTMPCTTLNGNMYSYFTKDDYVALRLPEAERLKFIEQYQTTLVQQYGIVQKEYVRVTDDLLQNTEEFKYWFGLSYVYASSLKAKPSAKSKK